MKEWTGPSFKSSLKAIVDSPKCKETIEESKSRGGSNKYPQSMLRAEIRKIIYTPVNPSFTI